MSDRAALFISELEPCNVLPRYESGVGDGKGACFRVLFAVAWYLKALQYLTYYRYSGH